MLANQRKLLSELKEGAIAKIIDFKDEIISSRLMTMGLLPGSQVMLIRKAPLQGGFYIKSDKQRIALRSTEAASILVAVK